jgi:hypothetical protein
MLAERKAVMKTIATQPDWAGLHQLRSREGFPRTSLEWLEVAALALLLGVGLATVGILLVVRVIVNIVTWMVGSLS